jgi:hypothetical protein
METAEKLGVEDKRPDDLLGVRACASKVGVAPSTISRQLANGLFLNWGTDRQPLVSLAEVQKARSGDLDPAQQRATPRARPGARGLYAEERAGREKVQRQLAELDLAARLGEVLPRAEVNDDFETFGRTLRERMQQRAATLVLEMEELPTPAAKAAFLIAANEKLFEELAGELETIADGGSAETN